MSNADFAEPEEDGAIVFCEECADACTEGAEIQYQNNTSEDDLRERNQRVSALAFLHCWLKRQTPDKNEAVN